MENYVGNFLEELDLNEYENLSKEDGEFFFELYALVQKVKSDINPYEFFLIEKNCTIDNSANARNVLSFMIKEQMITKELN